MRALRRRRRCSRAPLMGRARGGGSALLNWLGALATAIVVIACAMAKFTAGAEARVGRRDIVVLDVPYRREEPAEPGHLN